jgi:hypothetical protein
VTTLLRVGIRIRISPLFELGKKEFLVCLWKEIQYLRRTYGRMKIQM